MTLTSLFSIVNGAWDLMQEVHVFSFPLANLLVLVSVLVIGIRFFIGKA